MHRIIGAVAFFGALGVLFYTLAQQSDLLLLDPRGPIAFAEKDLMIYAVALMLIAVIPVFCLLFYFAWRYRDTPDNSAWYDRDWDHNWVDEFIWWAVPFAIVAALGVVAWRSSHALDPYRPIPSTAPSVHVQVVALDWRWLFLYPDLGVATINDLEIPTQTPIHLDITADAPMNSIWIPQLTGQIMAMPGMKTQLNFMAAQDGTYTGLSGNFSGDGFAGMRFVVHASPPEMFDTWASSTRAHEQPLTRALYDELAKDSTSTAAAQFSLVEPDLFDAILGKYMSMSESSHYTQ